MKKGYNIILSLRYTTTLKIESEKEDEAKIKDEARLTFVDGIRGTGDADDIVGDIEAVDIERNYSEHPDGVPPAGDQLKTYSVGLVGSLSALMVTVKARNESEAAEQAYHTVETEFTSESGKTDCGVNVQTIDYVELIEPEEET